jgi:hypothetical protein
MKKPTPKSGFNLLLSTYVLTNFKLAKPARN